jgi:hypothetical protein
MDARTSLRVSLLTLGLTAVLASAQVQPALSVTPNPATAGKPFTLFLQGLTFDCFTTFARESVSVKGNRIDLIYTSQAMVYPTDPPVPRTCPVNVAGATDAPAGVSPIVANLPMFPMPALAAGKYEVWASDVPECVYSGCLIIFPAPVSAGTLEVQKPGALSYTFTPTSAAPGQAFDLHLLSYGFTCGTVYENLVVQVAGNAINLSFLDHEQAGVACPAVYMPYGPTFKLPALPAGSYEVRVDRGIQNAFAPAGNLQITASVPRKGWYLKQRQVMPDSPFQMRLLQDSLPSCTSFSDLNAVVKDGRIDASFLMQAGKCALLSPEPIGPVFAMPALKAGAYPIYVTELLPCQVGPQICLVDRIVTRASDTLVVAKTLAVRMSALRAGAPKAEVIGNTAFFALPEGGTGAWRAELMTLDGRVLAARSLAGAPGERVSMPVGRAPAHAVSLLKLTSAGGSQRFVPIVR